jgi:ketosteroid isomerase-like protein
MTASRVPGAAAWDAHTQWRERQRGRCNVSGRAGVVSRRAYGETARMTDDRPDPPVAVADSLAQAMNERDIEAFVSLFAPDYESRQPAHPDRAFRGSEQVRENWSAVFSAVPDFRAELVGCASDGDTLWTEWRWDGTRADGSRLEMAGVIVMGVRGGLIGWARLYIEPIEQAGAGIDAAVAKMSGA